MIFFGKIELKAKCYCSSSVRNSVSQTSLISFFLHTTSLSICSENTSTAIHFFLSFSGGIAQKVDPHDTHNTFQRLGPIDRTSGIPGSDKHNNSVEYLSYLTHLFIFRPTKDSNMTKYFVLCASKNIICPRTTSGKIQSNLFLCKYRSLHFP